MNNQMAVRSEAKTPDLKVGDAVSSELLTESLCEKFLSLVLPMN